MNERNKERHGSMSNHPLGPRRAHGKPKIHIEYTHLTPKVCIMKYLWPRVSERDKIEVLFANIFVPGSDIHIESSQISLHTSAIATSFYIDHEILYPVNKHGKLSNQFL